MRRSSGGIMGTLFHLVWIFLLVVVIVAFFKVNKITNVKEAIVYTKLKSYEIQKCIDQSVAEEKIKCSFSLKVGKYNTEQDNLDLLESLGLDTIGKTKEEKAIIAQNKSDKKPGGYQSISAVSNAKERSIEILNTLNVVEEYNKVKYSRKDWKHWEPFNSNCWSAREEALYQQALPDTIVLLNKDKEETNNKDEACYIQSGKWYDKNSGVTFTDPKDLDVDHTPALKAASQAGGNEFTTEMKMQYANDLDVLIVTSAKENRSKGAKTPSQWMPSRKEAHCDYAKVYVNALKKYNLNITQSDKDALYNALVGCEY